MKNRIIEEIIKDAKRSINKKELGQGYTQENIDLVIRFCKKVIKENPNITAKGLRNYVQNYMTEMTEKFCEIAAVRGTLYQYEAIDSLVDKEDEIKEIYERLQSIGQKYDENAIFTANLSKSRDIVIGQLATDEQANNEMLSNIKTYLSQNGEKRKKYEKETFGDNKEQIKSFREIADKIKLRSDIIGIYNGLLKVVRETLGEEIKDNQIEMLEFIYDFIEKFDLLDGFLRNQNRNSQEFICEGIDYEKTTESFEKDLIGAKELFSREFLKGEKLENVFAYSMFYQNRVSKICTSINSGIFAIETLGLWKNIVKGKEIKITEKQEEALMKKEKCVGRLFQQLLTELKDGIGSKGLNGNAYVSINPTNKINQYQTQEGENFRELFEKILPNANNDLTQNIESYMTLELQATNLYASKDNLMEFLIRTLINSKKIKNWGIVLEEDSKDDDMALIAVDYEKINMPIRLHIPKSTLKDILVQYNYRKLVIPIYEGINDFKLNGKLLTTNLMMPLQKSKVEKIREKLKSEPEGTARYNLLEHLVFLSNDDKFPEHLKEYKGTKKGKKIYERRAKRYFDMQTGKIYTKNKNNEFEEVGDNCK